MHYNSIKEWAKAYSALKLYTFPCHGIHSFSKTCTCGRPNCKDIGKHPKTDHGCKDATLDVERFKYPTDPRDNELTNIGLGTGEQSGVIVIDEDEPGAIAKLEAIHGPIPKTVTAISGRGCPHYYFRYDPSFANVLNSKLKDGSKKIDVRTNGLYVIAPPSIHKSGNEYRWLNDPESTPLATMPDWLIALLPRKTETKTQSPTATESIKGDVSRSETALSVESKSDTFTLVDADTQRVAAYLATVPPAITGQGGMNGTFQLVCKLCEVFGHLRTDEQLLDDLAPWNETCEPPWTHKELRRKLDDARAKTGIAWQGEPQSEPLPKTTTSNTTDPLPWPTLDDHALTGLAGEIVRRIEPQSETDPVALLVTLLTSVGVAVGRSPHYVVEATKHCPNIFSCIVGRSSKSRKGTSLARIKDVLSNLIPTTMSGLSTGEGLVHEVRDDATKQMKDGSFETTSGVDDKRRWIIETEFARTLNVIKRDGDTLSPIMRDAWDDGRLGVSTRTNPLTATNTHIGMTAHITIDELTKTMSDGDAHNGFANRFLFTLVKSSKLLPDGGDDIELDDLRQRLATVIDNAKKIGRMKRSEDCQTLWRKAYPLLREEKTGTYDAITSRAEAITLRLSMLYALMDGSSVIGTDHLKAALALWCYADHSAEYLFDAELTSTTGADTRAKILELINESNMNPTADNDMTTPTESNITTATITTTKPITRGVAASVNGTATEIEPITPTIPPVTKQLPTTTIQAATLAELFDWRNAQGGRFTRNAHGGIVLDILDTPDTIKQAIIENQTILQSLVTDPTTTINDPTPPPSEPMSFTIHEEQTSDLASNPFIMAMRDADADPFVEIERRHLEAMNTDPAYAKMFNELRSLV